MNALRGIATKLALVLSVVLFSTAAIAQSYTDDSKYEDPRFDTNAPPAYAMIGDLLIARPLGMVFTAIGATAFVITLPFTAIAGNVGEAGEALVVEPAKATFVRCLGCTNSGRVQEDDDGE